MMGSSTNRKTVIIREILAEKDISETIINNSRRISKTLGFCEVGETLTDLVSLLFKSTLKNEEYINNAVKLINASLDSIEKTKE